MKYEEFRKWAAFVEAYEEYQEEQRKNLADYTNIKDIDVGIPNNFKIVKNKDTLYVLPAEPKSIKVKFKEENTNENTGSN